MNATQINEARALWVHQLALRQERIDSIYGGQERFDSTYGGAAKRNVVNVATDYSNSYILNLIRTEPFGGGQVYNPTYVLGNQPDGYFAELYTPYTGAGVGVVGQMWGTADGDVFAYAELGPTGSQHVGNYFYIETATSKDASWYEWISGFVGYAHVMDPWGGPGGNYYIGPAQFAFTYVNVAAMVMGPPTNQTPTTTLWWTRSIQRLDTPR